MWCYTNAKVFMHHVLRTNSRETFCGYGNQIEFWKCHFKMRSTTFKIVYSFQLKLPYISTKIAETHKHFISIRLKLPWCSGNKVVFSNLHWSRWYSQEYAPVHACVAVVGECKFYNSFMYKNLLMWSSSLIIIKTKISIISEILHSNLCRLWIDLLMLSIQDLKP